MTFRAAHLIHCQPQQQKSARVIPAASNDCAGLVVARSLDAWGNSLSHSSYMGGESRSTTTSGSIAKPNGAKYESYDKRSWCTPVIPAGNETRVTLHARLDGQLNRTYRSKPDAGWEDFGFDLDYECEEGSP